MAFRSKARRIEGRCRGRHRKRGRAAGRQPGGEHQPDPGVGRAQDAVPGPAPEARRAGREPRPRTAAIARGAGRRSAFLHAHRAPRSRRCPGLPGPEDVEGRARSLRRPPRLPGFAERHHHLHPAGDDGERPGAAAGEPGTGGNGHERRAPGPHRDQAGDQVPAAAAGGEADRLLRRPGRGLRDPHPRARGDPPLRRPPGPQPADHRRPRGDGGRAGEGGRGLHPERRQSLPQPGAPRVLVSSRGHLPHPRRRLLRLDVLRQAPAGPVGQAVRRHPEDVEGGTSRCRWRSRGTTR